jgi:hypothetical protein
MTLGRYQELVTAVLTVFLVVAAVLTHALLPSSDTTFLDAAALLALGATYGRISAANGYAKQAAAANTRLDKIGAPPAADPEPKPPSP